MTSAAPATAGHRVALGLLAAAAAWAYWPALTNLAARWWSDPHCNHGFLVPAFAAGLLWLRRDRRPVVGGDFAWGAVPLFALGTLLYVAGAVVSFAWLSAVALLPWLAGLAVLTGGWPTLRWAAPALAYLVFMVPLPYSVEVAVGGPLQAVTTRASTYLLQTLGFPALAEGNVIALNGYKLGVVEACSGLGMLLLFFAVCAGAALVTRRPGFDRAVMVASAVPIAVACNVARVTATGVLHEWAGARAARVVFHDLAGWLMMPLALGLLLIEMAVLSRLLVVPRAAGPMPPVLGPGPVARPGRHRMRSLFARG